MKANIYKIYIGGEEWIDSLERYLTLEEAIEEAESMRRQYDEAYNLWINQAICEVAVNYDPECHDSEQEAIEEAIEDIDNYSEIDGEYETVWTVKIPAINEESDNLLYEVESLLKLEYNLKSNKYHNINGIKVRIADHSCNSRNNDNTEKNLSFVIADKNATAGKFQSVNYQYYFNSGMTAEEIFEEIKEIIENN